MEFLSCGEFSKYMKKKGKLPSEKGVKTIIRGLLHGLDYLHSNGITHRDLKFQNVLISDAKSWKVKIADFGVASAGDDVMYSVAGSVPFIAPEVLCASEEEGRGYTSTADLWSLGIMCYFLLSGEPAFRPDPSDPTHAQLFRDIKEANLDYTSKQWKKVDKVAVDFVQKVRREGSKVMEQSKMHRCIHTISMWCVRGRV